MGEVVNLRRARKARARTTRETEAAGNRARFGRTSAEKTRDATEAERLARTVDGARIERDTATPPTSTSSS